MVHQDLNYKDAIAMIRRRRRLIGILALLGGVIGFLVTRVLPKRFESQTLVLIQQPTVLPDIVHPEDIDDNTLRIAAMQEQILSRSRLEPVIKELDLYRNDLSRVKMDELVGRLRKSIVVTPIQPMAGTRTQNLPGFYINVVFSNARSAQQICTKITSMFLEENLQRRQGRAVQTTEFLNKQVDDAKAKLDEHDAQLAAFQRQYLGSLPDESNTNLNLLTGLNSQLEASTQALARAQQDKTFTESELSQQVAAWQATQSGQDPETYDQQMATLQSQLVTLQSKYTSNHPDVIKLKNDIASLRQKMAESEQQKKTAPADKTPKVSTEPAQIQQLRAQLHQYDLNIKERTLQQEDIQKQIKFYQARVQASPAVEQAYKLLMRDHQVALDFYNDLLKKREESAMSQGLEQSEQAERFEVLDPANLPDRPSFPNVPLFAIGGFGGGLALGLALTLLLEMHDTSMRTERDVEVVLRLPVLAMVPLIPRHSVGAKNQPPMIGSPGARAGTAA